MNENLPNGISQIHAKQSPMISRQFNGLGSANSSRDPSPSGRFPQIPTSQLPPSRANIPSSQLPPARPQFDGVNALTQNYSNLNVSGFNTTPFSSPKVPTFSTSTPVIESKDGESNGESTAKEADIKNCDKLIDGLKKETGSKEAEGGVTRTFTHSATSQFTNVNNRNTQDKDATSGKSEENNQRLLNSYFSNVTSTTGPTLSGDILPAQKRNLAEPTQATQRIEAVSSMYTQPPSQINKPDASQNRAGTPQTGMRFPFQPPQPITSQAYGSMPNLSTATFAPYSQGNSSSQQQQQHNFQQPLHTNQKLPQIYGDQNRYPVRPSVSQGIPPASTFSQTFQTQPIPPPGSFQTTPSSTQPFQTPPIQPTSNPSQMFQPYPTPLKGSQTLNSTPAFTQSLRPPLSTQTFQSPPTSTQAFQSASNPPQMFQTYPAPPKGSPSLTQSFQSPPISTQTFQPPTGSTQAPPTLPQTFRPPPPTAQAFHAPATPAQALRQPPPVVQAFQRPSHPAVNTQQSFHSAPQPQFPYPNTQQARPLYPGSTQNAPNVTHSGFNRLWGRENHDLLQSPFILPQNKLEPPKISLGQDFLDAANCSSDIFRCTVTKIPESTSLLQKSRLPLGVLIHPFKDLNHLPVIQCNTIVRCRACRTYINPFVFFADSKRWKCNLCYRVNDLPDEFQFDPVSKTYGDPSRRPEVKSSTIEYIAPAEYMIRPPQPAVYLFLMDVSRLAVESGYLHTVCSTLSSELANLPGDARTQIGFVAYDSALHFYSLAEGQNQPHEMTVLDIDDIFLPCPDNLLVNLQDRMEMVSDLLTQLPTRYNNTYDNNSALGAALQVAYKMMSSTGGRITVFQISLPNLGPGLLTSREDPNQRSSSEVPHLNPANDFYKRLALECSGQQIAVDVFVLNSQFVDLSTISGISRFSGGCIHHFPLFKASRSLQNDAFERSFRRYITRKIGFEAVMRIRCTRGLAIHTFHGNFFVRSTDLLSLPNINPDAGFGMQVSIEENLTDVQTVCFQAALLYTSSKGERRIRVHTICLPVANNLSDVINSADQQCIVGLLSKMAVDRSMQSNLADAREAFLNVAIDILSSYKMSLNMAGGISGLMAPDCLKLLPLYISALLKNIAFRIGTSTRLDDRVKAMCDMKTKPLPYLMQMVYPDLYPVHNLEEHNVVVNEDDEIVHQPPHLQLTARSLDSHGAYLMDTGEHMILFVCSNVTVTFLNDGLGVADFNAIGDDFFELPLLENQLNKRLHSFLNYLNDDKPFPATLQVVRENSPNKIIFYERLIEDRLENSLSYHEFLQHIKTQVK